MSRTGQIEAPALKQHEGLVKASRSAGCNIVSQLTFRMIGSRPAK